MPEYVLYRAYDDTDRLLYVGRSLNALQRLKNHKQGSRWWELTTRVTLQRCEDYPSLAAAELAAIQTEAPIFNLSGKQHLPRSRGVDSRKRVTLTGYVAPGARFVLGGDHDRILIKQKLDGPRVVDEQCRLSLAGFAEPMDAYKVESTPYGLVLYLDENNAMMLDLIANLDM